jgi:hypothetical protein
MIVNSSTRINTLWRENIRAVVFCETDPIVGGSIGKVLFRTEQCTVPAAGLLKYGVRVSWCQNKTPRRALFSRSTQGDENDLNHIPQYKYRLASLCPVASPAPVASISAYLYQRGMGSPPYLLNRAVPIDRQRATAAPTRRSQRPVCAGAGGRRL